MNPSHGRHSGQKKPKIGFARPRKGHRKKGRDSAARWTACNRLEGPIRLPTRPDWSAILDLKGKWLHLAHWLLQQAERGQSVTVRRMAREVGIRPQTAGPIINPTDQFGRPIAGWLEWARYVIGERYNPTGLDYRFPQEYVSPTSTLPLKAGNTQQRHYPYSNQSLAAQGPSPWETTGNALNYWQASEFEGLGLA